MLRHLIVMLRYVDVRILYLFSAVFVVPVCLVLNRSRKTAYWYFRRRMGFGRLKSAWSTYINHCLFGQVVIDKFAMYAGKKFEIELEGYDNFLSLAAKPEGFVLLSSHIGNYEIAGYTLVAETKVFNALVFAGEKQTVMENRDKMFSDTNIRMIPILPDMSHLFAIDFALQNGEIVSMPADRIHGSAKSVTAEFLGADASFPYGAFSVATLRNTPVLAVNVMKRKHNRYKVYVTPLCYDTEASRKDKIAQVSKAYVAELERMLRMYPTQWYNFFDFWN
ncbi:MAG: lipid A biosynthesis acyltransferase [Bacteroidaceae bacterium]|nr:lipid A biosynthesis acyltransferase [Bacteroidaceae bacterium]